MEKESVGFVMYRDYMEYFSLLTNEEKAELIEKGGYEILPMCK